MKVHVASLEAFCVEALATAGLGEADACTAADVLVTTDTWGIFTHGTKNLRGYIRRIRAGGICKDAVPIVVSAGPAWSIVDGGSGLGMVTSVFAMRAAIKTAKRSGIAYVGVRHSSHFGAAGYYAWMAAREGMIGLAMCNDTPTVTAPGSKAAVFGSNPLAFAIPAGSRNPILFDVATSTVAGGKVFAAAALGQNIPSHWLVDSDGLPTTDAKLFPQAGTLTPMAGHKGYGLALLIETLSGLLTGAAITHQIQSWSFSDPTLPTGHGAAFLAMDVNAILPGDPFSQRIAQMMDEIRAAPKAKGVDRIYLPGEMEWERREKALLEGLELPDDVAMNLRALAEEMRLSLAGMS